MDIKDKLIIKNGADMYEWDYFLVVDTKTLEAELHYHSGYVSKYQHANSTIYYTHKDILKSLASKSWQLVDEKEYHDKIVKYVWKWIIKHTMSGDILMTNLYYETENDVMSSLGNSYEVVEKYVKSMRVKTSQNNT